LLVLAVVGTTVLLWYRDVFSFSVKFGLAAALLGMIAASGQILERRISGRSSARTAMNGHGSY
jgi:hypothetical protein